MYLHNVQYFVVLSEVTNYFGGASTYTFTTLGCPMAPIW